MTQESRAKKDPRTVGGEASVPDRDVAAAESDPLSQPSQVSDMNEFSDIGLSEHLSNVCSALGMSRPTPVQVRVSFLASETSGARHRVPYVPGTSPPKGAHDQYPMQVGVIPAALRGRDCIGVAETGSGKTAAFLLPILQQLCKDRYGVYAVILSPTRYSFRSYCSGLAGNAMAVPVVRAEQSTMVALMQAQRLFC